MSILSDELANDPLGRGYAGMTDQQAADSLNARDRNLDAASLSGDAMFGATAGADWAGLSAANKLLWVSFCGRETIDPFGAANVALVMDLFGAGSATITALAALRRTANGQSRAQELGLGFTPGAGDVEQERA